MAKRRYHMCVDVLGGIKNPKPFADALPLKEKH